jgi:fructokinase
MADVVCLGELLIDFVPTVTPTTLIDAPAFVKAPGGAPANVAVGLARLGMSSAFMGKVGDDPFGHFLSHTLADAGVDTGPLRFSSEARTALAFVSLRADGDREFTFYRHPSADMLFTPEEVDGAALRAAKALHYGSISLIGEPSRSATLHAIALAREAGCLISCDPNLRLALWPGPEAARAGLRLAMEQAHIVKLSDDEVAFLVGAADPLLARERLWTEHTQLMVVTRGHAGCIWLTREHEGEVPGFAVEAVDTTGAGDGFVAGLLHGLIGDRSAIEEPYRLQELCRRACAVGALAATQRGAIPALPTRVRVEQYLQEQASQGVPRAAPGDRSRLEDGDSM